MTNLKKMTKRASEELDFNSAQNEVIADTFGDPKFLEWLHKITILGYTENFTISTDHKDLLVLLFKQGKTPEQVIPIYSTLLRRLKVLKEDAELS